ncbi:MAG TPA: hypothetical protein VNM38_01295 [Solirubrobacterales bacterium]|nr:hypothetical protein [Solirubrobacterales bacterium]
MSKKTMLPALAAISAVMFVLPAAVSANWGVTPGNAKFTSSGPAGILFATGEPTLKCSGPNTGSGSYDGSGTTGSVILHFTECGSTFLGINVPCSTVLTEPTKKTIATTGTFHNVTITGGKRGTLLTPANSVIKCQNIANTITVSGTLIGEVTAPTAPCPVVTKTLGTAFGVSAGSQIHKTTDGHITEYDLKATTAGGSAVTAALEATATDTFTEPTEVTIDCNTP